MSEYQNIPLLPGEQALFAADFTPSPLARANKVGLVVTHQRVALIHPQHMFAFRVGHTVSSSPIAAISQITVGRLLSQHHVRRAIFAGFFGSAMLFYGSVRLGPVLMLLALCLLAVAAFQLWLARRLGLSISNFGGGALSLGVDQTEYQAMLSAVSIIEQLIGNTAPRSALQVDNLNHVSTPHQGSTPPTQAPLTYR
jgi:hypothetical protein